MLLRDTRLQYFVSYAMLGSVLPYVSVFFRAAGLSNAQVGYLFSIYSLASVLSPVLVTRVADGRGLDPRRLLASTSAVAAAALLSLTWARGSLAVFSIWTVYCLAMMPMFPLQDGIHFSQQRRRRDQGLDATPYHLVRAWGTVGFIAPSLPIFLMLRLGVGLSIVMGFGSALLALSAAQALLLPDPRGTRVAAEKDLPTLRAAAALLKPPMLAFSAAIMLMSMTTTIHSAFYPIHLTERVGLSDKWLGWASNVAVSLEIGFIFACGWLLRVLGLRRLLVLAISVTAVRFAILAGSSNAVLAIGTQVVHGLLILTTGVLPQGLFDERADDHFRHSMQGVLVMFVSAGRAAASFGAGILESYGHGRAFAAAACMCAGAGALVILGFHERRLGQSQAPTTTGQPDPVDVVLQASD
jgi:PPP family 3-phenylpropionic acid transporter